MLHAHVADGVHRIEDAYTNWYLVEDAGRLTIVDTGVPTSWDSLQGALVRLGHRAENIDAVVLTHAHYDHVGFAEKARRELEVPVYVHENDAPLARHPWRFDFERAPFVYPVTHPQSLPIAASLAVNRAFFAPPVREVVRYDSSGTLPVPGTPHIVFTPGHTLGHCSLHLPDRDVVIAGDALVMLDPYTARTGPCLVARAAVADSERNLRTLDALAATGARIVLTGHGEPWTGGAEAAVARAREAGTV
jgi:glyoxylase-like metal-dependent hydrolase (beta-lactamase superfamily II)